MKIHYLIEVELPMSKPLIIIRNEPIDVETEMQRFIRLRDSSSASPREKQEFDCISWVLKFAAGHGFYIRNVQTNHESKTLTLTVASNTPEGVSFFTNEVKKEIGYILNN